MAPASLDIVIIGAGHNGLITAFYLAKAGLKPLVLERRATVGGGAVTEEFHPGFRSSTLAHSAGPLAADIAAEMQLERHGLQMIHADPRVFAPHPDGRALVLYNDHAQSAQSILKLSQHDAAQYPEFARVLARISGVLGEAMSLIPPDMDSPATGDVWQLVKTGRKFRKLGKKDMFRVLRWGPMAVADLVAEWFENELLRATLAARGIFGANFGPWSAGSAALLLIRAAADPHPAGCASAPRGGMGALTQALAAAATAAGATIRTGAEIAEIRIKDGVAVGVVLAGGEEIAAKTVISNCDPRRTLLGLVDPVHLTPDFIVKLRNYRSNGNVAKVSLALDGLPTFTAVAKSGLDPRIALAGRIHIGPEIDYLERAFDHSKYGEFSQKPHLDVTIPTLTDPSLAPPGKHVMSIYAQFAPFKLKSGDWNSQRESFGNVVLQTLAEYAPDLPGKVVEGDLISPVDLQQTYGFTGGHVFHGELALDQLFTMRPLLGWARYSTPLRGLYLCGSGTHPGNGLTGRSGRNAARVIIKELRR